MKTTQAKYAKPSITTPTSKQPNLEFSGSQYNHKQHSRYNPKLVSAKPDSNLNSPSPLLQKIGFTIQTPCRSSSKLLYIKQKYSNVNQTTQQEISPKPTKNYTERPYYDKYSEVSSLQASISKPSKLSSKLMQSDLHKRESSLSPNQFQERVVSGKNSINIFEGFQKGSPTSSQAKLTVLNRRDSNVIQNPIKSRTHKIASPKPNSKNFLYESNDNKENINPINNVSMKLDNKNLNSKKIINTFDNKSLLNGSPEDIRNQQPTESNNSGNSCNNHPHKKAKYIVASDNNKHKLYYENENLMYCSKCAIKMVANGHKIQELVTSTIDQRKSEVEEFLERISQAKGKSNQFIESIRRKQEDVALFYSKQVEKAELVASAILKIVNEEKMRALEELTLSQEQTLEEIEDMQKQIEDRVGSITSIQYDIEKNLHNILRKIDTDPFKTIMKKYNEKLDYFLTFLDVHVKNHQVSVSKLPGFKREILEGLKSSLLTFFDKVIVSTSLIKRDTSPEKFNASCKPSPQTGGSKDNLYKNSLYVSFENKEIFENAIEFSQQFSTQECQSKPTKRSSELHLSTNDQRISQVRTDPDMSPMILDSFRAGYTSGREEPRGFAKKADIDLESIMTNRTLKTPQSSRSQQIVFNTTQTKHSSSQTYTEERLITHRQNPEFDGAQMSLLQRSFEDIPTVRYSKFGAESNHSLHNRYESCPKLEILISNSKESTNATDPDMLFSSQGNPSTMKYINILEKITTSQSRKNAEYSDLIKVNSIISPQHSLTEDKPGNEVETPQMNEEFLNEFGEPSERMAPDRGINSGLDDYFENSSKELKNYPPFFHFLENRINNDKPQLVGTNYQKSLFCCSPNFKENIEPTNLQ